MSKQRTAGIGKRLGGIIYGFTMVMNERLSYQILPTIILKMEIAFVLASEYK